LFDRITNFILHLFYDSKIHETSSHEENKIIIKHGSVIRHGVVMRQNGQTRYLSHTAIAELTDEEVINWLTENDHKKRQVVNPDHLPYDRRKGF
jgi:hypothetical protein